MTEPDELEMRWPRVVARYLLWGMLAVVLYVLSIGPAVRLADRLPVLGLALEWFYKPLAAVSYLGGQPTWLDTYLEWWGVPLGDCGGTGTGG